MSKPTPQDPDVTAVIKACDALLARGELEAALIHVEGGLQVWSEHPALRRRLATTLRRLGRHAEARSLLEGLLQDHGFSLSVGMQLAGTLRVLGHLEKAAALFQQCLDAQPDHEGAQAGLIEVALARGEIDTAVERSTAAVAAYPASRVLRHRHATALRRSGREGDAQSLLEVLHAEQPDHLAVAFELAAVSRYLGDLSRAEDLYTGILNAAPENEAALAGLIEVALARGEIGLALARSTDAVAAQPGSRRLRQRHATALQRSGQHEAANAVLETLHAEQPDNLAVTLELAAVCRHLGDVARAEALYRSILATAPDNEGGQGGLISIDLAKGEIDAALGRSTAATAARPESRLLRHRHATCLRSAGRHRDARAILEVLHTETPEHVGIATDLAVTCRQLGDLQTAEDLYRHVLAIMPASPAALQGLIAIAEATGSSQAMIGMLEAGLGNQAIDTAVAPPSPDPARTLRVAELLVKAGETQRAAESLGTLTPLADAIPENDLALFIRLADRLSLHDVLAHLLLRVRALKTVRLHLALTVLRLVRATEEPELIHAIERDMVARIHPVDRLHFMVEAALLQRGPSGALATLLATPQPRRSARDAQLLGRFLLAAGRTRLALRYLGFCYRRWPNAPGIRSQLASAFMFNGQHTAALAWLETRKDGMEQAEMDSLLLNVLLETQANDAALAVMERQLQTGQRQAGSDPQLRLLIALGRLQEAEAVEAIARRSPTLSRSRAAHFGTSHAGALLTELRMYHRAQAAAQTPEDRLDLIETNYHAACETLRRHAEATAAEAPGPSVPRRIVQYWNDPDPPSEIRAVMRSWQSLPGWEHLLFDHAGARRWLTETLGLDHARAFAMARHVAEEADFLRLCLLFHGGGIYADADDLLVGHPDGIVAEGPGLVVFFENYGALCNNVICAPPGHPALGRAVHLTREALLRRDNDSVWLKTGPGLLTRAVAAHLEAGGKDVSLRPQGALRVHVRPHVQMPYKQGAGYWNKTRAGDGMALGKLLGLSAQIGAAPTPSLDLGAS